MTIGLQRLAAIWRWEGVPGLLGRTAERLGLGVYHWLELAADQAPEPGELPAGCSVRELGPDVVAGYVSFRRGTTPSQFVARLRAGHRCLAVCSGDAIVAADWIAFNRTEIRALRRDLVPPAGEAYVFDAFVRPPWRGRHLLRLLLPHLVATARSRGCHRLYSLVAFYNRSSLRPWRASGFRRRAVLITLDLGPIHRQWCRGDFTGRLVRPDDADAA